MQQIAQRPVHGQHAAGERAVGETHGVLLLDDAMLPEAILAVRHAGRRDRVGDAIQLGIARSATRAAPSSTCTKSRISSARSRMRQRRADRPGPAVMQAAHGVEQVGEAGRARGERRTRLGVAARGVADLRAHAARREVRQQRAVRVDLGRHGRDPDRREGGELVDQSRSGAIANGGWAPSACGLMNGPSRWAPRMRAAPCIGGGDGGADAAKRRKQLGAAARSPWSRAARWCRGRRGTRAMRRTASAPAMQSAPPPPWTCRSMKPGSTKRSAGASAAGSNAGWPPCSAAGRRTKPVGRQDLPGDDRRLAHAVSASSHQAPGSPTLAQRENGDGRMVAGDRADERHVDGRHRRCRDRDRRRAHRLERPGAEPFPIRRHCARVSIAPCAAPDRSAG